MIAGAKGFGEDQNEENKNIEERGYKKSHWSWT